MQVGLQDPGRVLTQSPTDTKRDVIGPSKHPQIAQEIAKELDLDRIFSPAKYSISIGHHQIFHGKGIAQFSSHEAIDPIGTDQEINRVIGIFFSSASAKHHPSRQRFNVKPMNSSRPIWLGGCDKPYEYRQPCSRPTPPRLQR